MAPWRRDFGQRCPNTRRRGGRIVNEHTGNGSNRNEPDNRKRISLLQGAHISPTEAGKENHGDRERKAIPSTIRRLAEADALLSSFRIGWKTSSSRYGSIGDQPPREHPSPAAIITISICVVAIKSSLVLVSSSFQDNRA
jgi:hypothetical protein